MDYQIAFWIALAALLLSILTRSSISVPDKTETVILGKLVEKSSVIRDGRRIYSIFVSAFGPIEGRFIQQFNVPIELFHHLQVGYQFPVAAGAFAYYSYSEKQVSDYELKRKIALEKKEQDETCEEGGAT